MKLWVPGPVSLMAGQEHGHVADVASQSAWTISVVTSQGHG
jgi:hypothetical protein